jgi:hypothetical protein
MLASGGLCHGSHAGGNLAAIDSACAYKKPQNINGPFCGKKPQNEKWKRKGKPPGKKI